MVKNKGYTKEIVGKNSTFTLKIQTKLKWKEL